MHTYVSLATVMQQQKPVSLHFACLSPSVNVRGSKRTLKGKERTICSGNFEALSGTAFGEINEDPL